MPRRRSKLEIILTILSAIRRGVKKPTHIMYAANLSWKATQIILKSLVKQELIKEIKIKEKRTSIRYELTQKGDEVFRYFNVAMIISSLEERQTEQEQISSYAEELLTILRRSVSTDDFLRPPSERHRTQNKISDLMGSWETSDREIEEIKKGLIEGWKIWR